MAATTSHISFSETSSGARKRAFNEVCLIVTYLGCAIAAILFACSGNFEGACVMLALVVAMLGGDLMRFNRRLDKLTALLEKRSAEDNPQSR